MGGNKIGHFLWTSQMHDPLCYSEELIKVVHIQKLANQSKCN